jgi:hypothetical protein
MASVRRWYSGVAKHATRPNVQAVLMVVGRRDRRRDRELVDLGDANLTRANLSSANLTAPTSGQPVKIARDRG